MFRLTLKTASRNNVVLSDCGRQPSLSTVPLLFYRGVFFLPLSICGKSGALNDLFSADTLVIYPFVVFLACEVTFRGRCRTVRTDIRRRPAISIFSDFHICLHYTGNGVPLGIRRISCAACEPCRCNAC